MAVGVQRIQEIEWWYDLKVNFKGGSAVRNISFVVNSDP